MSRSPIPLIITLSLLFLLATPLEAQEGIEIDRERSTLEFPTTITFELVARSSSEIETISLFYGVDARRCQSGGSRQDLQFEPATEVDVEWSWDLRRSGSLPPGTTIWWRWRVTDADGNVQETQRKEQIVTDDRVAWRSAQQSGITVHWYVGDNDFGQQVLDNTITAMQHVGERLGLDPPEQATLWIYPDSAAVRDALAVSADWAGAVAFPTYDTMYVSLAPGQTVWEMEVVPHEMAHLIVGEATFNCRGGRLPVWLNEGLAVYAEGSLDPDELEDVLAALENDNLVALQSLADGFSAYGRDAGLAYTQSGAVTMYLVETYGLEELATLLAQVRQGQHIDQALDAVYGFDTVELDNTWRTAQGFEPLATPNSAGADATPTPVPTLALIQPPVAPSASATSPPATATPTATAAEGATATRVTARRTEPASPAKVASGHPEETAVAELSTEEAPANGPQPSEIAESARPQLGLWVAVGVGGAVILLLAVFYLRQRKGV
ncbi:MAG: peptidase MA family metallohydrolase [Candidatus Promineifilaceae bacterium]|nr:peptidase MA family metallohydrolase [Candidatus Promineifilaceae bacterium]